MDTASTGLAALYEQERSALLRFLAARCGDMQEAEDALQELWLKLATLDAGPIANGKAYLFRMANNLVLDRRRGQMRAMRRDREWLGGEYGATEPDMRPDPAQPADEALAREQEAQVLHHAIANLPPGARRALQLFRFDGMSQAEVAEAMGISRSGVEKHLSVAMKHLRQALADCGAFASVASKEQDRTDGGQGGAGKKEWGR